MNKFILGALAFFMAQSTPLRAQIGDTKAPVPQIVLTARGEVRVTPDRANIQISVQSRGLTAAATAAENANKQAAIIAGIKSLGISDEQISTSNYNVSPEQKYEPNQAPIIVGYVVTNTVNVEVRKIAMVGAVIDVALARGANLISGLSFYAANSEGARRLAIASAVATARADADAAARAAGGAVAGLIELTVMSYSPPMPRPMMMRAAVSADAMQAETPISPGQDTLTVEVMTRWRYLGPGM